MLYRMGWLFFATISWCALGSAAGQEQYRSTDDGVLTVTVPDPSSFTPMTPPPPSFAYGWEANNQSMRMAVRQIDVGMNPLLQADAEQRFSEEFGAPVQRLPDRRAGQHLIWSMQFDLENGNRGRLDMFRMRGTVYQLFGVWSQDEEMPPDMEDFFNSIQIARVIAANDPQNPAREDELTGDLINNLSRIIGGCACLLLFVSLFAAGLIYLIKKLQRPPGR